MNKVTIVTVAYNSANVLPGMLGSLRKGAPATIVDNASGDVAMLRGLVGPDVTLLEQPENIGFGRACNAGAALANTEFLLFLNPDARLMPDTLPQLVAAADRYPDAVGFNPRFTDDNGAPAFKRTCHLLPRSDWMPRGQPPADCALPVLSGAALFVRRADFEAVGGFDPNIFLFFEDDDLSLRLRKRGKLMFIRDALVQHTGGNASHPNLRVDWLKAWHFGYSRIYASRKHGRRFAFAKTLVRAIPRALSPRVLFSPSHRAESWGYLNGIVHAQLGRPNPGDRL